jgi:glycine/D-amino acid oxidase-like deaminating enzyme
VQEPQDYRALSLWHDTLSGPIVPRPQLAGDVRADVAIAGAGYTGLWTAWYLTQLEPGLRVAMVEAEVAGFGASGRNGGWCLGSMAGSEQLLAGPDGRAGVIALQRALFDTVDEVGRVCAQAGIDCHFRKSGTVSVATAPAHVAALEEELAAQRALGFGEADYRWLEPEACRALVRTSRNLGGLYNRHCAALHPARLARGLAEAVERRGVAIYERSPATSLERGAIATPSGRVLADTVVRATEAYTARLAGHQRAFIPVHSLMIATGPLPEPVWKEIGLPERETFGDPRRVVVYAQRTADDRLAFGSRGMYLFGSRIQDRFPATHAYFEFVRSAMESLFPVLRGHAITHRWGGALAIPRDWRPSVWLDRDRGLAAAGGYVGEGVAASNLAGRTLAELILRRESPRTSLPIVGHRSPRWEREPLRYLGVTAVRRIAESLDRSEFAGKSAPRLRSAIFDAFVRK